MSFLHRRQWGTLCPTLRALCPTLVASHRTTLLERELSFRFAYTIGASQSSYDQLRSITIYHSSDVYWQEVEEAYFHTKGTKMQVLKNLHLRPIAGVCALRHT